MVLDKCIILAAMGNLPEPIGPTGGETKVPSAHATFHRHIAARRGRLAKALSANLI